MVIFIQTNIKEDTPLKKNLETIYGVGKSTSRMVLLRTGVIQDIRGSFLRRRNKKIIQKFFLLYPKVLSQNLKKRDKLSCQTIVDLENYRGKRHKLGFPVRGQRTRTNSSTQKRLHKRWLLNTYKKPLTKKQELYIKKSKFKAKIKAKNKAVKLKQIAKSKKVQPKKSKPSKYKI